MLAFGILFPLGMVLGIIKSRWHVPLQVLATLIAMLGWALGHLHGGRKFLESNVHAKFANFIFFQLVTQIVLGIYLKLHLEKGIHARIRPVLRLLHDINGKAFPVVSWTQMLFGGITALGFCQGDHLGQCLAHFIMGSAFIAYGIILTILLLVGQLWLRRTGRSQEFFDSVVIAAWGFVNSLTEHRWGTEWVKNDWQHTTMGIIWFAAGLAGVWLSKDREGNPQRNFIPGFVLLMTGWAMSAHPQELMISAMTHKMFGYTLMGAGLTRIIEISFVLGDKPGIREDGFGTHSFQYVPVFLLFASGFLFMGATEEQMALTAGVMDAVAYVLILYSLAFLLFLFVMMLVNVYDRAANPIGAKNAPNGHALRGAEEDGRLRDAGEFELEGLMTDDEEDEEDAARRKLLNGHGNGNGDVGLDSPGTTSTLGRNSERLA
ncbi:putative ytp1-like protein [Naviculisporaceae sp. PSN 640]